ncbi:hypothetical protein [Roseiconus lacunae]|uniref:hypothetical protein n=1 Tax=Roseiconus lacunae TaxID=2605694 RepID=UPI001E5A48AD|nr:hypothetical protein [Roseiconus lacunae]MCD0459264.1 hypothetical protein [Roseiconus lacunae]
MRILYRYVLALLTLLLTVCVVTADDPVAGTPQMIIDARIDDNTPNGKLFVGTTMDWIQNHQSWNRERTIDHGGRSVTASIDRGRSVLVLRSKRFAASFDTLKFTRLNGDSIDSSAIKDLLARKRAVVFLHKGTTIHPAIVGSLHPETLVVTRVSYPVDPLVIGIPEKR